VGAAQTREILTGETHLAHQAMRALRTTYESEERIVDAVERVAIGLRRPHAPRARLTAPADGRSGGGGREQVAVLVAQVSGHERDLAAAADDAPAADDSPRPRG
jgi:hypothetical protein